MKATVSVALLALAAISLVATPACALAQEGVAVNGSSTIAAVSTTGRTVPAGKVHWHASLAEATAAAEKTGKPVLHFQLLGDLDQEFC